MQRYRQTTARLPWLSSRLTLLCALGLGACSGTTKGIDAGATGSTAEARARELVDPSIPMPLRVEMVALADEVALLATKEGKTERGAQLLRLAAALRVRAFRVDHAENDLREAIELYRLAREGATGTEAGCDADRARAELQGELFRRAEISYREIYLASRRQSSALANADASPCVQRLRSRLASLSAFRPSDAEMAALATEGDAAYASAARADATIRETSASAAGSSSSGVGSTPPMDVVVDGDLPKAKGPVKVTSVEHYGAEGGGRVVVNLNGATSFHVVSLPPEPGKDARVYVDIDSANAKGIPREIAVGGAIKRIRTAANGGGVTRVVLDLAEEMHRRIFYLPEPFRIVIDVSSRPVEVAVRKKAGEARVVKRVVIDAGHGGDDSGAIGPTGLKEKDVTLDIAHRVAPILAHELGIETLVTRDTDVFVPLDERAARANAFHADLFVSIHCNASENGDARGVETFVLDAHREESRANARIAALENGLKIKTLDPVEMDAEMAKVFNGLKNGAVGEESRVLGDLLGRSVLSSLAERYPDTKDHGVKSAAFYVLAGAEMPAILFETSFISNPVDEARLGTADYRQKMADAIANAIKAYREGR